MATLRAEALDALPDALMLVAGDRVEWVNASTAGLLQDTPERLTGRAIEELLAPGDYERMRSRCQLRRRGLPVPEVQRLRFRASDGTETAVDVRVGIVGQGGDEAFVLSARDRKESARAEALMIKLARLTSDIEQLGDVPALIERASSMLFDHGWYVALFVPAPGGYQIEHLLIPTHVDGDFARYVRSLVGKTRSAAEVPLIAEVFATGKTIYFDEAQSRLRTTRGRGRVLAQEMRREDLQRGAWIPVRSGGAVSHVLVAIGARFSENDVTPMELLAGQIAVTLRVEQLSAELVHRARLSAIGEMATVLAHEVRNPLTVILNATRGLARLAGAFPEADPAVQLVGVLREEAERLRGLARDLLALATPTSLQPVETSVEPAVRQAVEAARSGGARGETCAVDLDVAPALPEVRADPLLIERAVSNLLVDAAAHAPSGTTVDVTVTEKPGFVEIAVHRGGSALPGDTMLRLFDPFVASRASGTGLGLAVVRRIAEDHGGYVRARNVPEGGVTLTLGLPAGGTTRA